MAALPLGYQEPAYQPVGSTLPQNGPQEMMANFDRMNEDEKARLFQQHLQKGLDGMVEVMGGLPEEVKAKVGDPSDYADTDEKRLLWYQGVNTAINRLNQASAAAAGDVAQAEQLGLNDPSATNADFQRVADNTAIRGAVRDMDFNKTSATAGTPGTALIEPDLSHDTNPMKEKLLYTKTNTVDKNIAPYEPHIKAMSEKYGVPESLIKAIIARESRGIADARNPDSTATGMMQLIRSTAKRMGVKDPKDPLQNIEGGTKYLSLLLKHFDGDVEKATAAYHEGEGALGENITKNGDKWKDGLSPAAKAWFPDVMSYRSMYGGATGGTLPGTPGATKTTQKTSQDIAQELVKSTSASPEAIKKMADMLGSTDKSDIELAKLAMRAIENQDKNTRFNTAQENRKAQFEDKTSQALYDDLVKAEVPVIGSTIKDLDKAMEKIGGLKAASAVPGTDVWNKTVYPWLKSSEGVKMQTFLNRLYSLELKRISGVAVTDAEFERHKAAFANGLTYSPEEQMYALRSFVRAYRQQLSFAKAAYGKVFDRVAGDAGLSLLDIPEVPDAVGTPPTGAEAPAEDKAAKAKAKYKLDY